jgi:hypothetical protein
LRVFSNNIARILPRWTYQSSLTVQFAVAPSRSQLFGI